MLPGVGFTEGFFDLSIIKTLGSAMIIQLDVSADGDGQLHGSRLVQAGRRPAGAFDWRDMASVCRSLFESTPVDGHRQRCDGSTPVERTCTPGLEHAALATCCCQIRHNGEEHVPCGGSAMTSASPASLTR